MANILILGDNWKYAVLSEKEFFLKHDGDSLAITDNKAKVMEFTTDGVSMETIIHEVFHAYRSYQCTGSATINDDEYEEIYAEFFAKYAKSILQTAKKMYNVLKKNKLCQEK